MLVEMVKLRQMGRKCSREQLRAQVPVRGDLSVYVRHSLLMAAVLPELSADVQTLQEPRLTRMRGDSFVVVGYEQADMRSKEGVTRHPQAWWCRLPGGPAEARSALDLGVRLSREERRVARAERG
jgi:hypothetical protein